MTEAQVQALEKAISEMQETITNLTHQKGELEQEIDRLRSLRARLIAQLPTDNRINHLFD